MIEVAQLREHQEDMAKRLRKRGKDFAPELTGILELDDKRKAVQVQLDDHLAKINATSKDIGKLFQAGSADEAKKLQALVADLKTRAATLKTEKEQAENNIRSALYNVPNVPHENVPGGASEDDNEIVFQHTEEIELISDAIPHWELAKKYGLIDFELGVKVTGAGFPVYTGKGARLQRALIQFFLDEATKAGYLEVMPPFVVNEASGIGTGQLPDKEGQMYHVGADDLYLIPTAEVPVTNLFRDEIISHADLPKKLTGYTPCFRREAGSYGKHVRGLNRLHQFDKVEIVRVEHPDHSYTALNEMIEHVKMLLQKLELPFRMLRLCGGDLGFAAAITYDMEVYSAAQERWLEVSSISNFETYQSNRLHLRIKDENNRKILAHTLNGSALALPRILAALLENNQTKDGITIPEVLRPYTGFDKIH